MRAGKVSRQPRAGPRIRLTIDIDPELRRELRMEALQRNIPLRKYITRIIEHRDATLEKLEGPGR